MCNDRSDYDADIPAVAAAARAMLAALQRVLPAVEAIRDQDLANDLNDEGDVAAIQEAIALARAAGIVEESK